MQGVIGHFRNDPRIDMWDVFNEPDNDNNSSYGKSEAKNKNDMALILLQEIFEWAREMKPKQPLTSAMWLGDWADTNKLSSMERVQLQNSDVVSFHNYGGLADLKKCVENLVALSTSAAVCTEYMARPAGSTFDPNLKYMHDQNVGAYNWGFVSGKTQTIYPWDSWDKTYTAEPPLWFHDIFRSNGVPYNAKEVNYIKSVTLKPEVLNQLELKVNNANKSSALISQLKWVVGLVLLVSGFLALIGAGRAQGYPPVAANERLVGIAYTTWHRSTNWSRVWGHPELGDYVSTNRAVIRQHAEWLSDAGVDFVLVDWSNNINQPSGDHMSSSPQAMIENGTYAMFDVFASMPHVPKISVMLGVTLHPEAVTNGLLQLKADQVYRDFIDNPKFRPLVQDYAPGKPLLVIYVNTPSPFQHGLPDWNDSRFTVRWMTGYLAQQPELCAPDLISKYGYWSWEDRQRQTYPVFDGHPEVMTVVPCWRGEGSQLPSPGRRNGETFREQWARAREIGPKFAFWWFHGMNGWLASNQMLKQARTLNLPVSLAISFTLIC